VILGDIQLDLTKRAESRWDQTTRKVALRHLNFNQQ